MNRWFVMLTAVASTCLLNGVVSSQTQVELDRVTKSSATVFFSPSQGALLKPGMHFLYTDSDYKPLEQYDHDCELIENNSITETKINIASGTFEASSSRELAVSVQASLGMFASGELKIGSEEWKQSVENTFFARIDLIDGVSAIKQPINSWPSEWKIREKGLSEDLGRFELFVATYGTHYVKKVFRGKSILVQAKIRETNETRKNELEAKLRGGFSIFQAEAKYAEGLHEALKDYQFDLVISVQAGELRDRAGNPLPVERMICTDFLQLSALLRDMQQGEVVFDSTQIRAEIFSLATVVNDDEIAAELFGSIKPEFGSALLEPSVLKPIQAGDKLIWSGKAAQDGFLIASTGGDGTASEVSITEGGTGGILRGRIIGDGYTTRTAIFRKGEDFAVVSNGLAKDITVTWIGMIR